MKYTKLEEIGSGGFAKVYRAIDEKGRLWALKQLSGADTSGIARFRREVRIQQSLKHPNIVPIVAANLMQPDPFCIMPLAEHTLEALIPSYCEDPALVQSTADKILKALEYAHEQAILHRDLKPRNILVFGGVPRISDFGLGKKLDGDNSYNTVSGDNAHTYWYAPPEQVTMGLTHCDARSDVYSLGKLLLHCLTGSRVAAVPRNFDNRWQYIINRAIRDSMDDRWPSIAEMRRQFELVFDVDKPLVIDPDDLLGKLGSIAVQKEKVASHQVEEFVSQFQLLRDDEVLLKKVFVRLPTNLVEAWLTVDPDSFRSILYSYDEILADGVAFDYCDIVADHYLSLLGSIHDVELRQWLFRRLFVLGPDHNRWHVGEVFCKALGKVMNAAEREFVIELAQGDEIRRRWNRQYIARNSRVDRRIRDAFGVEKA